MAKTLTDRAKVRVKFKKAYAYQWGPRDWNIYGSRDSNSPVCGLYISGSRSSEKAAWQFAAVSAYVTGWKRVRRLERTAKQ